MTQTLMILRKFNFFFYFQNNSLFSSYSYQCQPVIFHWSLGNNKSPQVSRTLLRILADLNNVVIWIVSIHPQISNSSSPFPILWEPLQVCQSQLVSPLTLIFHSFFSSQARSKYLTLFAFSLIFTLCSTGMAKSIIWQILFFCCFVNYD